MEVVAELCEYLWKVWIKSCMAFSRVEGFSDLGIDILEKDEMRGRGRGGENKIRELDPCTGVTFVELFPHQKMFLSARCPDKILLQMKQILCLLLRSSERTSGNQDDDSSRSSEPADKSETLSW
ncbi:hypothetical protein EYF80_014118 [Liparis tanakae]|uniref:Uncharacterized protein n=1 Tax=Liparis tanakae TaxID=230148 RepID=A0A4Z2IE06_9TELE|nr:hypothetical protein EYF80_014118 [Liparis tanakae]